MFKWIMEAWEGEAGPFNRDYYTTDGGHLAPHPGMTDDNLYDYECDPAMNVPPSRRQWPTAAAYTAYRTMQKSACGMPPPGWKCSRGAGHPGPCAATPDSTQAEADALMLEVVFWLDSLPNAIRVREGGGPENIAASFALNIANLTK